MGMRTPTVPATPPPRGAASARALVLAGLVLAPAAAGAQTIHGVVVDDESEEPIAGVMVELQDPDGRGVASVRTDASGAFLIRLSRSGTFMVRMSHPSYAMTETRPVMVGTNESVSLELRMGRAAIPLAPVTVRARADARGLAGFHERRMRPGPVGVFLTRDEIAQRPQARATELLRVIPGIHLSGVGPGGTMGNFITMTGAMGVCAPTVYVDGLRMHQGETLDMFLRPNILEGVEVYRRGGSAPAPITAIDQCGVVAFWTRTEDHDSLTLRKLGAWMGVVAFMTLLSRVF